MSKTNKTMSFEARASTTKAPSGFINLSYSEAVNGIEAALFELTDLFSSENENKFSDLGRLFNK